MKHMPEYNEERAVNYNGVVVDPKTRVTKDANGRLQRLSQREFQIVVARAKDSRRGIESITKVVNELSRLDEAVLGTKWKKATPSLVTFLFVRIRRKLKRDDIKPQ